MEKQCRFQCRCRWHLHSHSHYYWYSVYQQYRNYRQSSHRSYCYSSSSRVGTFAPSHPSSRPVPRLTPSDSSHLQASPHRRQQESANNGSTHTPLPREDPCSPHRPVASHPPRTVARALDIGNDRLGTQCGLAPTSCAHCFAGSTLLPKSAAREGAPSARLRS